MKMLKITKSLLFTIMILFPVLVVSQEDGEQLSKQAFKWFPEGNYAALTALDISAIEDEKELELFRLYYERQQIFNSYDPFENFLPRPLGEFKYYVYGKASRFKVRKPTEKGKKKLRESFYSNGGNLTEFGGQDYFIRNEGFELFVCIYNDPASLIAEALKRKQIAKYEEALFGLNVYFTTPTGAKLQRCRYFCTTGSGEILIANSPQVLEMMLDAGFSGINVTEDEANDYLFELTENLGVFWQLTDLSSRYKVSLEIAKKAGDQVKISRFQKSLDRVNLRIISYYSLKKKSLRKGTLNIYADEENARNVYSKYKEVEGIDRDSVSKEELKKNHYYWAAGTKNEMRGKLTHHQYRELDRAYLLKRIEEAKKLKKELENSKNSK